MKKALEMSEEFFFDVAYKSLKDSFPKWIGQIAAGLVGNGSECFGYDDELSRDHDWGVDFYLWLTEDAFASIGADLSKWKQDLVATHPNVNWKNVSQYGVKNTISTSSAFYKSLIGFEEGPKTILEWRRVPEANLAMCVNGKVFVDPTGEFTKTREYLKGYYPEQLRLKKIAARCMNIAQSGQYNFLRIAQRGDTVAKEIALSKFVQDTISMVFMLNKQYMPYYKWSFRAMRDLPILAGDISPLLEALYTCEPVEGELDPANILVFPISSDDKRRGVLIEKICALIIDELKRQNLSHANSTFLAAHGQEVQNLVTDKDLSRLPAQYE